MIPEWMKERNKELEKAKHARDGIYYEIDEHRENCAQCNRKNTNQMKDGSCREGVRLVVAFDEACEMVKRV